tara:strand:- start:1177 stop:1446 length:270 start_codon:yes stop_codon:yes gene_type:complete
MVRPTSIMAYDELKISGKELTHKEHILRVLKDKNMPMSRRELSAITGIEISGVAGRVNALIRENKIVETDRRKCLISKKKITPVKALTF